MGNLVFQATLGGQVSLVGPNTASTFTLNVPAVSSTLATLAAQTFTGTQTMSTLTSPAATNLLLQSAGTTAVTIDTAQNVGVGVTPSAWSLGKNIELGWVGNALMGRAANDIALGSNTYYNAGYKYAATGAAAVYESSAGVHYWYNAASGTAGNAITFTQAMTLNAAGTLLVNATSAVVNSKESFGAIALDATGPAGSFKNSAGASSSAIECWNSATTGDNKFITFASDAYSIRGTITYNRAGGLTAYNVTSDYRAKTVNGPVQNALLKLSSLKPCTGRMNGAEMDIDFFVAHELQEIVPSAVTGVKDSTRQEQYEVTPAVKDEDGNLITEAIIGTRQVPDYQMVDKSALIPLLTAAIQELNAKVSALEAK